MFYDATKVSDVDDFARMVSTKMTPALAGFIVDQKLMIDNSPEAAILRELAAEKGVTEGALTEFIYFVSPPEALDDFRIAVIAHISLGNDTEDENSVGGFSQREIDLICDYINFGT